MAYRGTVPLHGRSRRRWLLAAGIATVWLVLLIGSGSLVASSALLFLLGAVAAGVVVVLRAYGFGRDHPWFHHAASRPWRDGRDVLRVALRHFSEVFIVTPQGSLLAPNAVELRMNPDDIESLAELIDLSVVNATAAEAYAAEVAASSARVAANVPLEVCVVADPAVPPGRYRLRQRAAPRATSPAADPATVVEPGGAAYRAGAAGPAEGVYPVGGGYPVSAGVGPFRDGRTKSELAMAPAVTAGAATVTESALAPVLRLITNGEVAETRVSGARAGRSGAVELQLPEDPTVSRVHATFTCTGGEWRITVLGRNGALLNGTPLTTEHVVRNGDAIRWGQQSSAPVSAVVIG